MFMKKCLHLFVQGLIVFVNPFEVLEQLLAIVAQIWLKILMFQLESLCNAIYKTPSRYEPAPMIFVKVIPKKLFFTLFL